MEEMNLPAEKAEAIDLDQKIKYYANAAWINLMESAKCLKQMRDTRLYTQLGYESFEDYSVKSLGIKERQAYTYISAYENLGERFLQSNANIGITKLSLLSQIPPSDRQDVVDNNDLAGMTVEEVKKLVAENDAKGEQISALQEEIEEYKGDAVNFDCAASNYQKEIEDLKKELYAERNKPTEVAVQELPAEEIQKIKDDAAREAKKEAQKEFKEKKQQLESKLSDEKNAAVAKAIADGEKAVSDYKSQLAEINGERNAAAARAKELEKKLTLSSSPESTKVAIYFDAVKINFDKLIESLKNLHGNDAESADKLKNAMLKYCEMMREGLEEI